MTHANYDDKIMVTIRISDMKHNTLSPTTVENSARRGKLSKLEKYFFLLIDCQI